MPERPSWCTVPEPTVVATAWHPGQLLRDADDPDRLAVGWAQPGFVERTKGEAREVAAEVLLEEDGAWAGYYHNVLSEGECGELIEAFNKKGFTPALLNIGGGRQQYMPKQRRGLRCLADSPDFANLLFARLSPHLPQIPGFTLIDFNERLRALCYSSPDDSFPVHCDGAYVRPKGHPHAGDCSAITLQLYLNTIPDGTHGGGTRFNDGLTVVPRAGSVLAFTQVGVPHSGEPMLTGGLKFTVRTEAMYRKNS